ncbi:hypothetical protein RB653_009761 [Dictyostelium firmibasis]|uniref:Uncharacterized protein n=1 Tax=Dictyostelium firmibasis TaxID=79012 RepID=A0AAN7TSY5_9MYCE
MGRTSKSNADQSQEEAITVTRSGRTIIKPGSTVTNTPSKSTTAAKKTTKNKKSKESDEEDSSENEEQNSPDQKSKKKNSSTTVNRKEKTTKTTPKKQQKHQHVAEVSPPSSPEKNQGTSSATTTTTTTTKTPTKKYTQEELDIITRENRNVYIKFFIFSILMVVVPLFVFKSFNTSIGDYLGISRQERVTYAGVASLGGLILVMAAYSIMAYYEK